MKTHQYRTVDVPVAGGVMRVGVWDPIEGVGVPTVLAVHGITSSHLAWPFVVAQLPGVRVIAPDLRGRGASNALPGPAGLRAHAVDLIAVLDAFEITGTAVIGHSMGGFVAVALTHLAPDRVDRLVLIDGGLPLDAPAEVSPEELVAAILGPTADRLSMRFASVPAYLDFWREHPAFVHDWSAELEDYFAYDLVPVGAELRPATSLETVTEDTIDMNTGSTLPEALASLDGWQKPVTFVSVPRGLRDETPGLYAPAHLERMLGEYPAIHHVHLDDLNHYTVVLSTDGAEALGSVLRGALTGH